MLAEQRYEKIVELVEKNGSVTVCELKNILDASEATIRRDIVALHNAAKLTKVFGGAVAIENNYSAKEPTVAQKVELNREEKIRIGRYAATMMASDEFVFIDAGTSTACMIEFVNVEGVTFVTNAVAHAQCLAAKGARVYLLGGEVKNTTEAIVGNYAVKSLKGFHFTKGFFGANGVSKVAGFTTPDADEALIKETAMSHCKQSIVLADSTKFNNISSVTFGNIEDSVIVTDKIVGGYEKYKNIIVI